MDRTEFDTVRAAAPAGSLMHDLNADDGWLLVENASKRALKKGTEIFQQGDKGDFAGLILSGAVKICTYSASGREIVYAYLSTGDIVGELSALDGAPRTATASVIEKGEMAVINRAELQSLMLDKPKIAVQIIENLCLRLRNTNALLESDRASPTGPRLARGLLRLLREHGVEDGGVERVGFKISQSDLGSFVSLSRENVNRQLHEWVDDNIVAISSGRVDVLDREALEEIADYY